MHQCELDINSVAGALLKAVKLLVEAVLKARLTKPAREDYDTMKTNVSVALNLCGDAAKKLDNIVRREKK